MCWKAEYALLILISTVVDYFVAIKMSEIDDKKKRRPFLYISLLVNLGFLFTFKYLNFFSESVNSVLNSFNIFHEVPLYDLLLPVGISFYTFQTLSYSIDVYNDKVKPEKNFGIFALYVSFFPQLVAGPIERPDRLLPQFHQKFDFDYERVVSGLKMMAIGFFMKLVIADRLSQVANMVFNNPDKYEGFQVIFGTWCFTFQIFGDFAGYSLIAIGAAKVMGFELMQNFRRPYFSQSIREFWTRWHISLSSWFRDYVYIPLGGNRVVKWRWYYNLMITFLVSGLWHGANWTFVIWGGLHGLYLVLAIILKPGKDKFKARIGLKEGTLTDRMLEISTTFALASFAWIFFRANSVGDAFTLISNMTNISFDQLSLDLIPRYARYKVLLALLLVFVMELYHGVEEWGEELNIKNPFYHENTYVRWTTYVMLVLMTLGFGVFTSSEFIYFQF